MYPRAMPARVESRAALGSQRRSPHAPGPSCFDHSRAQASHQSRLPREPHSLGVAQTLAESSELHRQHDQEHIGEQAHRIDAVGQGGAVGAALQPADPMGLPGIGGIAHHQAHAGGGQDHPEDQAIGIPEHATAEAEDQQDLDQVVQSESEQPVPVAGHQPAGSPFVHGHGSLRAP